ncbi:sirohydrochlorin chelatase [Microbacterium resistens]|uniref:sirohydrochlorin chelatase n=1 Tax=Microbacterium resistens TaxID=156977 RepID=UPI00082E0C9F|nr:CbiX/SirB N-terminal domain-containing protein [Microbacterium resistens]
MSHPSLLAVSHGTSDPRGAAAIALLVERVAARLPDVRVRSAFVDVQQPDAETALAGLDGSVVVVPLLLSRGFHVGVDLGRLARPGVRVTDPLGPDPRLAAVLARRLAEAASDVPVVLGVAGSRDPRSLPDAERTASLLARRLRRPVTTAYLAARAPRVDDALRAHPGAVLATYLLAPGYFFDLARRLAEGHPVSAPLLDGAEPPTELVDIVVDRYRDAEAQDLAPGLRESALVASV